MKVRLLVVILVSLFIVSMGAVYLFFRDAAQGTLGFEAAKSLLQVGVVAVAGAVISALTFEYQRGRLDAEKKADIKRAEEEKQRDLERKSIEYRESLLMSTLKSTMDAYSRIKKARRFLRARARVLKAGEAIILAEQYDLYIGVINDAQLDFENLARDIKTSAPAFTESDFLKDQLRKMDSYLGTLISEYEKKRGEFAGEPLSLKLAELHELANFMLPSKESKFEKSFVIPYHNVQGGFREELMHPRLVVGTKTPVTT